MTGTLTKKNGEWVVKYDRGHEVVFYELDQDGKNWSKRIGVMNFIHEGIELDFTLITSGQYNEEQEFVVKEFHAKILHINHDTI
jgi:hypothetical protein